MKRLLAIIAVSVALCGLAAAQGFYWRDRNGARAPDTDSRKSSGGFGGWLVVTSDGDWEAKWNVPDEQATPSFNEAHVLRNGETVVGLIFIGNPVPNASGEVNVRCDVRVTRPNGTLSVDQRDMPCLTGRLQGDPLALRLAAHTLKFVGEEGDPVGIWSFDVALRDVGRGVVLNLHTTAELRGDG